MNIQEECSKIHSKYGMSEMANYKIQLLFDSEIEKVKKEYEEKLRWIPVEEKLPEKIQKYPYISHVVQVRSIKYSEPLCAYYNHEHRVWLSYPFSNSAEILPVTDWRYFL